MIDRETLEGQYKDSWLGQLESTSELCSLIKREAAVFLSVSVIPLFLAVLMFYSGGNITTDEINKIRPCLSLALSWGGGKFKRLFLPALKVQTQSAPCTVVFISSFPAY